MELPDSSDHQILTFWVLRLARQVACLGRVGHQLLVGSDEHPRVILLGER